jgi:hypothetical protein
MSDKKKIKILWIVQSKRMIKDTDNNTYKYAENLSEVANTLKPSMEVSVEVDDNTIVSFGEAPEVAKQEVPKVLEEKKEPEKQETKQEETIKEEKETVSEAKSEVKTYTVSRISKDKKWWMFQETGDKVWFGVDDKVKNYIEKYNIGDIIEITYQLRNDGKKDLNYITFVKAVKITENASITSEQTSSKKSTYSSDSIARAKNTAVMVAKDLVVAYINGKALIVDTETKTAELLKRLTATCYEAINQL